MMMNAQKDSVPPIIVDLGKVKSKRVKRLKRGQGVLMDEVDQAVAEVRHNLGPEHADRELVPVVMIYRKKKKKKNKDGMPRFFPFPC